MDRRSWYVVLALAGLALSAGPATAQNTYQNQTNVSNLPLAAPTASDVLSGIHGGSYGVGGTTSKFAISALGPVLQGLTPAQLTCASVAQCTAPLGGYPLFVPSAIYADGSTIGSSDEAGFHGGNNTASLLLQSHSPVSYNGNYTANYAVIDCLNATPAPIPTGPNAGNVAICLNVTRNNEAKGLFSIDSAGNFNSNGGGTVGGPLYADVLPPVCPGPTCFLAIPGNPYNGLHVGGTICPETLLACGGLVQSVAPTPAPSVTPAYPMLDLDAYAQSATGTNICVNQSRNNDATALFSVLCNGNAIDYGTFLGAGPVYADNTTATGDTNNGFHAGNTSYPALLQSLAPASSTPMTEIDAYNQTSTGTNPCLNVTRNNGATTLLQVTCAGTTVAAGAISGGSHNVCSTTSGWPCETALTCSLSSATTCSGTIAVPAGSVCTLTANASDTTTGVTSWKASVSSTTLTGTVTATSQTSTAAANATCL